jgi:hypothetical protein
MNLKQFRQILRELRRRTRLSKDKKFLDTPQPKQDSEILDVLSNTIYNLECEQRRVRHLIRSDLNHVEKWIDE